MLLANSLIDGFFLSNGLGKGIVYAQILLSVVMVTIIIGKWRDLLRLAAESRRFRRDFDARDGVLDYLIQRRPTTSEGMEGLYRVTCERLLSLLPPQMRMMLAGHTDDGLGSAVLDVREIELVRGTCEHHLEEEELRYDYGMGFYSSIVTLEPMLGLLGTVWGVLDAFAVMGTNGSASLATIAPSISSALVTTVVGLLVALPGAGIFVFLKGRIRQLTSEMEGLADELISRMKYQLQGKED